MTEPAIDDDPTAPPVIEVDQFLAHPPATVWRALTDPAWLARWWAAGDVAPTEGHEFLLDMGPWGNVACRVTTAEADRRFAFTFGDHWTLTWDLVAEGSGTRLLLTHAGFDPNDPQDRFALDRMGPGWRDDVLPRLVAVLDEPAG